MATQKPAQTELAELVRRMEHLQAEHTPLLTKIEADAGMSRDVKSALVEHLNQEEDELRTKIAQLSPGTAARIGAGGRAPAERANKPAQVSSTSAGASSAGRLTVGSLRRDSASTRAPSSVPAKGAGFSVGSLRRR
ncbi:MAG TPA: hypothetical protein VK524_32145 [Polyangiaceae bacterium]|nr:hypothetical protein [Polyangiaceae bacterium]